ncbi:hypothetical protein AVEN_274361-1 [Araneus ventricosus]|uniref:Uncharacterized protein n=1 Tax=Araneus ventricosus TaxID=182803 RepID=A0A4Y2GA91_ARAVE|nr:hypothetical protein AVEN_274361-1 [Araneus ventricosus]
MRRSTYPVDIFIRLLCCTLGMFTRPKLWSTWPSGMVSASEAEGSSFETTEVPSYIGPAARQIIRRWSHVLPLVRRESLERRYPLRNCPHHLNAVLNYEVPPKVTPCCFKTGS